LVIENYSILIQMVSHSQTFAERCIYK